MKLRQLFEATETVGIIFGRFNPPHQGHKAAWEEAAKNTHWYVGTNKSTIGPKDPLPFDVKIQAMETIWPEIKGHIIPEQTWWSLAAAVYKKHGEINLKIITDETDAKVFVPGLQKSNGVESKHGYFKFKSIEWQQAPRVSSATELRAAVANDDPKKFAKAAGVPADTKVAGEPFFDLVKYYLGQQTKKESSVGREFEHMEDVSPDEENEFHVALDKLVHKYFGHSSDEKKKKKSKEVDEIWGFARQSNKRSTYKKKKEEPIEPSVQDRIAARRKAAAKGDKDAWASKKEIPTDEAELNEAIPVAVLWIIKWAIRYGAWPVLKWLLKKHGGKIIGGAAAAYYIDQGWDWVKDKIGAEYAQMLIDNKFEIGMAVALIVGAVVLKKYIEKQGEKLVSANESLIARS